eukprot:2218286-Rhodomonas_salina.1
MRGQTRCADAIRGHTRVSAPACRALRNQSHKRAVSVPFIPKFRSIVFECGVSAPQSNARQHIPGTNGAEITPFRV